MALGRSAEAGALSKADDPASETGDAQDVLEQHFEEEHRSDAAEQQADAIDRTCFVAKADRVPSDGAGYHQEQPVDIGGKRLGRCHGQPRNGPNTPLSCVARCGSRRSWIGLTFCTEYPLAAFRRRCQALPVSRVPNSHGCNSAPSVAVDRRGTAHYGATAPNTLGVRVAMRMFLILACVLPLAGCGATVLGQNRDGIWFREPYIGGGWMQSQAEEHCAAYGKTAVYAGTLDPTKGYALPVVSYNCR